MLGRFRLVSQILQTRVFDTLNLHLVGILMDSVIEFL